MYIIKNKRFFVRETLFMMGKLSFILSVTIFLFLILFIFLKPKNFKYNYLIIIISIALVTLLGLIHLNEEYWIF